jgi:glyoxylase-like metal-dependent hydrolase (beta-lactamase superfamily II)
MTNLMPKLTIVDVGYRSTHFWVVSAGRSRLLVDLGWPGRFGELAANLRRMDIPLHEIRYGLATHYHIDHAGAAQDLKNAGVPLLVIDVQAEAIVQMKRWIKPADRYTEITTHDNRVVACAESRALLAGIGIPGEILHTPGHSPDSVSLLLDTGEAFIGDLTRPEGVDREDATEVAASWRLLRERGATTIYPAHGEVFPLPADGETG